MNVWRWLGFFLFLAAASCFIGVQLPAFAGEKDKDGNFVVEQQVVGVKMKIDIGGNKIEFDSTLPEAKQPKNPMTDFFNALMKQKLTFTITPGMEVKKIDGREEFIKSLSETN